MNFKTITFRQIFITLTIIMFANLAVNVFQGSTTLVTNDNYTPAEMVEVIRNTGKDYQLDVQHNGDITISTINEDGMSEYVGTYKQGGKCDILAIIDKDIADND